MSQLTTHSTLHSRMTCFINWIKPDPDKKEYNDDKASLVRKYVSQNAEAAGLRVVRMPVAGSDAKGTGLRRHYLGHAEVDGYDIDLVFILEPKDADSKPIEELLAIFEDLVRQSYPDSTIEITKSSVKLLHSDDLAFDIVPMLATANPTQQLMIKRDGRKVMTSVEKHTDFVKLRTRKSKEAPGRVCFNEVLRAMKWHKEFQADGSYYLSYDEAAAKDNRPPSALIDWLAAYAFDRLGVEKTYAETLAKWYGFLANVIKSRIPVYFTDYYSKPDLDTSANWIVLDPVNSENNIVGKWPIPKVNEFASWFESARDSWSRIIRYDIDEEDNMALNELVKLFGNPFKHHCDKED
jgi:hypothetical protein